MRKFNEQLLALLTQSGGEITSLIENDELSYPFSLQAKIVMYLIAHGTITYEDYIEMYNSFKDRNPYIDTFEKATRNFGETWLENKILALFPFQNSRGLVKATKTSVGGGKRIKAAFPDYLDPLGKHFSSQFDFICFNEDKKYKVEVKSSRASADKDESDIFISSNLTSRAYSYNEAVKNNYQFHFQQIKPGFCDIFIFVGVCTDQILYWVLTPDEIRNDGGLTTQHPTTGTKDINDLAFEGQVSKSIADYQKYLTDECNIFDTIIQKLS